MTWQLVLDLLQAFGLFALAMALKHAHRALELMNRRLTTLEIEVRRPE